MRFGRLVQLGLLATLLGSGSIGCGSIDIPVDLALVGDNTISIEAEGSPPLATTLVGGVETTISANLGLFSLLNPNGIMAGITVDDLLFAGENIPILGGLLNTGTLCIEQNLDNPGGGSAHGDPPDEHWDGSKSPRSCDTNHIGRRPNCGVA